MKVIDLLNKIANGEINENTLIEFDNGYKDYCSIRIFFDRYIMDRENLNCEVEIIEEDKKIERLQWCNIKGDSTKAQLLELRENIILQFDKINEIIDYLEEKENDR